LLFEGDKLLCDGLMRGLPGGYKWLAKEQVCCKKDIAPYFNTWPDMRAKAAHKPPPAR
jgi:hypothetical protein